MRACAAMALTTAGYSGLSVCPDRNMNGGLSAVLHHKSRRPESHRTGVPYLTADAQVNFWTKLQ